MFWQEPSARPEFEVPDDVFDLVFRLRGDRLAIDHAFALATALEAILPPGVCDRIGVHGVWLPGSGNGWTRPEQGDAELPLSRRARLVIRVHRDDCDAVRKIGERSLELGRQRLEIGSSSVRKLSSLATLHARGVSCDPAQSEQDFLADIAVRLRQIGVDVKKMICGRSGIVRGSERSLFTRALMVAELKPEDSVRLQQRGLGDAQLLGCGLFVPHKGIAPVYETQD